MIRLWMKASLRESGQSGFALGFFVFAALVYGSFLEGAAPKYWAGYLWSLMVFSLLSQFGTLYRMDFESGFIHIFRMSPTYSVLSLTYHKAFTFFLIQGLPLAVAGVVISWLLGLPDQWIAVFAATAFAGLPALSLLAAMLGLLMNSLPRGGVFAGFALALPFTVPVLLLSLSAFEQAEMGLPWLANIQLLGAYTGFLLLLAPFFVHLNLQNMKALT